MDKNERNIILETDVDISTTRSNFVEGQVNRGKRRTNNLINLWSYYFINTYDHIISFILKLSAKLILVFLMKSHFFKGFSCIYKKRQITVLLKRHIKIILKNTTHWSNI